MKLMEDKLDGIRINEFIIGLSPAQNGSGTGYEASQIMESF